MIPKTLLLAFSGILACSPTLRAQNENNGGGNGSEEDGSKDPAKPGDAPAANRFWSASVGGGSFMVALDRIVSISRHKYVLDGAVIVDEVTVDTVGQALARFYCFTPITAGAPGNTVQNLQNRAQEVLDAAGDKAGTDVHNMVVKKYPDTTHAKSIEYRVKDEQELKSLYSSVQSAWESSRGRKFTAK
ncbi:MAG: hypothetical protein EOP88_17205 [Verrucomicrobiaceae bacterium]|nr:MAG: hypothetical protein EOP88_17205 [Verrucomicrobiaceae bacterium]